MIPANVALPMLAVITGWLALFPVRRDLGPWVYHLAAFPVGIVAWPVVTGLTTLLGLPMSAGVAVAGHALFATAITMAGALRHQRSSEAFPAWTWAAWGTATAAVSLLLERIGYTAVAFDSFTHYELSGIWLFDTGKLDALILGTRGPLIPAMHAGTRLLGGEWTYVPYTVFSLSALALLAVIAFWTAFAKLPLVWRIGAATVTASVLGLIPQWMFHSFFVHSNMVSAAYFTLAVAALLGGAGLLGVSAKSPAPWWLLAGIASAGIALSRPDGLAYSFVVLAVAAVMYLRRMVDARSLAGLYSGLAVPMLLIYLPVFATQGVWRSDKLQGSWALALMVATAVFGVVTWVAPNLPVLGEWLAERGNAVRLAASLNVVGIVLLSYIKRGDFYAAASNMLGNLMAKGGWGYFWYAVVGIIVLSLLFRSTVGLGERETLVLYAVAQFFALALVVHGLAHEGRLHWMDSFNRVALHAAPVAWWYVAMFVGRCIASCSARGSSETS